MLHTLRSKRRLQSYCSLQLKSGRLNLNIPDLNEPSVCARPIYIYPPYTRRKDRCGASISRCRGARAAGRHRPAPSVPQKPLQHAGPWRNSLPAGDPLIGAARRRSSSSPCSSAAASVAASAYRPFIPARQLPEPPPDAPVMVIDAHRSSRWFERDRRALCRLPGCPSRLRRVPGDRGRRAHAMGAQERPLHGQNPQRGERTLHADTAPL